ncbi:MAG: proprotein convertase P-domain-containing protein [Bacteroidota bacterium]
MKSPFTVLRISLFSILLVFCWSILTAQSISNIDWKQIPIVEMPKVDNADLRAKELERRENKEVPEFAVSHKVNITPSSAGKWSTDEQTQTSIWQLRIHSKKAHSLNFGFTDFFIPEHGELYLYSAKDGSQRGPFTPADNDIHNQLWTPIVNGDDVLIEVQLPTKNRDDLRLTLSSVNHDFIGFESLLSQRCHIDVNCGTLEGFPEVNRYRDIIESVSMYSIRGTRACTGFLVNNTRQDCTPYYMTADHCGITANNAASIVAYWNYENPTCRPPNTSQNSRPGNGNLEQFNSGAVLRASRTASDMMLLELDDPIADSIGVFFAGWNRMQETPDSAICIHHPNTEEKRISFTYQSILRGSPIGNASDNGQFMIVQDWDVGSTEGGSSGSPLFNMQGEVIGQLFGGEAACGNNRYDSYGSFATSWASGTTAATRLADWLDRDGFGLERLSGKWQSECGQQLTALTYNLELCTSDTARFELINENGFASDATVSIADLNEAFQTDLLIDSENTTQATLVITGLENAPASSSVFKVTVDELETFLKLTVLPNELSAPTLSFPLSGNPAVSNNPFLQWEMSPFDPNYEVQISTDSIFDGNIAVSEIVTNSLQISELQAGTTYYWRVRARQACGVSEWSAPFVFTTAFCEIFSSNNVPISISSGSPNSYRSTLNIAHAGVIADLNVSTLRGRHTWIEDLEFELESPRGTRVQLLDRPCLNDRNFDLQLDDESNIVGLKCPPDDGRAYRPVEALSAFRGEEMLGEWALRFRDNEFQDGGQLQAWGVEVCQVSEQFDVHVEVQENRVLNCGASVDSVAFQIGQNFDEESLFIDLEGNAASRLDYRIVRAPEDTIGYVVFSQLSDLNAGGYVLELRVEDQFFLVKKPFVLVKHPIAQVQLTSPQDRSEAVMLASTILEWEGEADEYEVQLSETATFDSLLYRVALEGNFTSWLVPDSLVSDQVYFWRVIARTGCGDRVSEVFQFRTEKVVNTNSILQDNIELFPNPSDGLVQLKTDGQVYTMSLYDAKGRLLERREISGDTQLDFAAYPAGVYHLKLQHDNHLSVHKLSVY